MHDSLHVVLKLSGALACKFGKITNTQTLFNIQKAREATQPAWTCSVEKAKNLPGYRQCITLHEGMAKTYGWYKQNGWL